MRCEPPCSSRRRPSLGHLVEHRLAEPVAGAGEREGDVGVEALQRLGLREPPMPESSEAPPSARLARRELATDARLLRGRALEVVAKLGVVRDGALQRSTPPAASSRETAATR